MNPHIKMRLANKGKGEFRAEGNTIWLYDAIASDDDEAEWFGGVSPRSFIEQLSVMEGDVTLRINSPGGSVFGAQAMVAAMREHNGKITARVDSLAASAASVIATEAAELEMAPGSMLMIHKAWGLAIGNADDFRQQSDLLEKIDGQIAESYSRRSGRDPEQFLQMMRAETWFTADEAVNEKLADAVLETNTQRPKNRWDLSAFIAAPWEPKDEAPQEPEAEPENREQEQRQRRLKAELAVKGI